MTGQQRRGATVQLPPWLWGNDLLGFAREAQLKLHPVDAATRRWGVEALEKYEQRPPGLFELLSVAPADGSPNWTILEGIPPTGLTHSVTSATMASERERLLGGPDTSLAKLAAWVHLSTAGAPDAEFVDAVRGSYDTLRSLTADDGASPFPDVAVHFVRVDAALSRRATLARVLLQVEEDPTLLTTKPQSTGSTTVFGSAWHLQADLVLTRGAYLGPLFLCLSPWIWAITGSRIPGVVVYDLGSAIIGRSGEAAELLQQFLPSGLPASPPRPAIRPNDTLATITWWVARIDKLMSEVTDPSNYVDRNGDYHPRRQFEVLLSIEQLGRRIQSILANDRDLGARRLGAFAALDTLHGLGIVDLDHACKLERANSALRKLQGLLPASIATMLLPAAERGVDGLRECQQGFFLQSRVGPSGVRVLDKHGGSQTLSLEEAVAAYLRVLRNANHGFTGENAAGRRRDQILLMAHDGNVPDGVAFLPYLYWLEMLADPSQLLKKLAPPR